MQKDRLFIYLDSAEDFDSYMVKMEDIVDNFSLEDANSVFDDGVKNAYASDKFNFLINIFSYMKYDLTLLMKKNFSPEAKFDVIKSASGFAYKDLLFGTYKVYKKGSKLARICATISSDVFADNFVFSDFNIVADNTRETHYDHVVTIAGLNSVFESLNTVYEYLDSG
jgi:hypothetical protein